ncbi:ABC transporter permease [Streptosporangium sp. NBC_01755]|uniref:ABC transporter permease n=1 Tax=unclassified Streptosporangium TaxID=2632669 RepID=UPI002DD8CF37|nr:MULTISPECIES: ABC transporter permease [unclassified Streptosporangium]WSA28294.1 ABC transporter permease [Streptosporangium sp. NBC_01810]WSD00229.1 ABC transporter permease [Streptosporangium sp. NBC_01755]
MTSSTISKSPLGVVRRRFASMDQGYIVAGVLLALVVLFSVTLPGFSSTDNLLNAARSASTLGLLAIGMTVVVIARGLDLSVVIIMGVSCAMAVELMIAGHGELVSLAAGLLIALTLGLINGLLVAYVEVPPLFVTLATSLLYLGFFRIFFLPKDQQAILSSATAMNWLGNGTVLGIPSPVLVLAVAAAAATWFMSRNYGRFVRSQGDNPAAASLFGLPTRPLLVSTYLVSASAAFIAGVVGVSVAGAYDLRAAATGTTLYDVIAVVVIGGVSLAGARGSIGGVVCAALLLGVIGNAMTLLNMSVIEQSLSKAFIVLLAIVLDSLLHPRDEETARVGDM